MLKRLILHEKDQKPEIPAMRQRKECNNERCSIKKVALRISAENNMPLCSTKIPRGIRDFLTLMEFILNISEKLKRYSPPSANYP
jgi:hypothetical protein